MNICKSLMENIIKCQSNNSEDLENRFITFLDKLAKYHEILILLQMLSRVNDVLIKISMHFFHENLTR